MWVEKLLKFISGTTFRNDCNRFKKEKYLGWKKIGRFLDNCKFFPVLIFKCQLVINLFQKEHFDIQDFIDFEQVFGKEQTEGA